MTEAHRIALLALLRALESAAVVEGNEGPESACLVCRRRVTHIMSTACGHDPWCELAAALAALEVPGGQGA